MVDYSLEELVASVATRLMAVDSATIVPAAENVLRELADYFAVDQVFLRHHDLLSRTSVLVAEWPKRPEVPHPDPLGVVAFSTADTVFAASEHLQDVLLIRPGLATEQYQQLLHAGAGVPASSAAIVPLRASGHTTGALGFVKYGDRTWTRHETNALRSIAGLWGQLQGRLVAEDRLQAIAHREELTGLPNRRALLHHMERRLAASQSGPLAALFVDIDRLKAVNDHLGHSIGDQLLQSVAARLRDDAYPEDFVACLGGDEFVIILAGRHALSEAVSVASRVQTVVNAPACVGGYELDRSVSIGVAVAERGECTVAQWLHRAKEAVLDAKARGGNSITAYTVEMEAKHDARSDIEMHLHTAIHNGSLILHYQPKVDMRSGRITGVEALVRWNHPTLGLLQPDSFIGVAEATNLAGQLGHWVLHEACSQLARWQRELPETSVEMFVNVSPVQLIARNFVTTVAECLAEHGISGERLTLEITEHAVVSDLRPVLVTLNALNELGVEIAIDDFGTGYSSLVQLKALSVHALKIDRGFVHDLGTNPSDLAIVRSIAGLAAEFGLQLIAEGVETVLAAQTLLNLGCYSAQGYLFSRPVPAREMQTMLEVGTIEAAHIGDGTLAPAPAGSSF